MDDPYPHRKRLLEAIGHTLDPRVLDKIRGIEAWRNLDWSYETWVAYAARLTELCRLSDKNYVRLENGKWAPRYPGVSPLPPSTKEEIRAYNLAKFARRKMN